MAFKDLKPQEWIDEIDEGLEYRRRFGLEDKWGDLEAIYYNVHSSMLNDGPNIFLSQGDAMLSTVTVPSPQILVKPTTPEGVQTAPLVEALDRTLLRDLEIPEEVDQSLLHTFLFGRGIVKMGYDSEWGFDPRLDLGGSLQLGLTLSQFNEKGTRAIEHNRKVSPGMPWVKSVLPHDIIVPWGVNRLDSAPWIAHRVVRHIDDLRADRKYENVRRLEPTLSMRDFVQSYKTSHKMVRRSSPIETPEFVEFYEVHDRRTRQIVAVVPDHDRLIRKTTNLLQIENRLPFASVHFTPTTRAFWTTPDAWYLYFVQNELSDAARQRTKQRRLAVIKFLYDKGAINEAELEKLLSPDVGAAAAIEAGRKLNEAVVKLENTPSDYLVREEELLRANAREQIGFSRNQLGEFAGGRRTATEAAAVDRASLRRMTRRSLAAARLYRDVIAIVNNIIFEHWTIPRYIEVLGQTQGTQFARLNGLALKARYNYEVKFTDESEERGRKLEALQLYGLLSQDPMIDQLALREFLVSEFNDPKFERIFSGAALQSGVQQVQGQGGGVQSQGSQRQRRTGSLPGVRGTNGEAARTAQAGQLAGGRISP